MVASPAVKEVYDTGNATSHGHINMQEWYECAKPHIVYLHIKAHGVGENAAHTWPDAGESYIRKTLREQLGNAYNGFISIEPHLEVVAYEGKAISDKGDAHHS